MLTEGIATSSRDWVISVIGTTASKGRRCTLRLLIRNWSLGWNGLGWDGIRVGFQGFEKQALNTTDTYEREGSCLFCDDLYDWTDCMNDDGPHGRKAVSHILRNSIPQYRKRHV